MKRKLPLANGWQLDSAMPPPVAARPCALAPVLRQRQQVFVAPGRRHLAVDAGGVAVAIPADPETVAIGDHLGLGGAQALSHQGVLGSTDQVFEIDRIAAVSQEPAHAGKHAP
jgi:hypothetical protein